MKRGLRLNISGLWLAALLICIAACSGQSLSPPERLSIGEYGSGTHSRLEWHSSNHGSVSFELEWRFGDVPHWVPLSTTSPEATVYHGSPYLVEWNTATYCYRGRAVLGDAKSEWSDEVCDGMYAGEPHPPPLWPGSPFDVVAEAMEEGVRFTWAVQDLREYGQPQSQVLRRESTSGKYTVISELPFATFKSYDHDRRYGTFEFIDSEGSREYCYRIATSLEDRGGRSISGDVCLPQVMVGNLPSNLWQDSTSLIAFNEREAHSECGTIGQSNRRTCRRMSRTRPVTHLVRAFGPLVVTGLGSTLNFST